MAYTEAEAAAALADATAVSLGAGERTGVREVPRSFMLSAPTISPSQLQDAAAEAARLAAAAVAAAAGLGAEAAKSAGVKAAQATQKAMAAAAAPAAATAPAAAIAPATGVEQGSPCGGVVEGLVQHDPTVEEEGVPLEEEEIPVDFPRPITYFDEVYPDAVTNLEVAMLELDKVRAANKAAPITHFELVRSWSFAAKEASFKHCVKFTLDKDDHYATVDTVITFMGDMKIAQIYPLEPMLPMNTSQYLEQVGWALADQAEAAKFPCDEEHESLLQERTLGLLEGVTSIAARPRHPDPQALLLQVPSSYSFRTTYPSCSYPVMDQGSCGSCYAFVGAAMAGERRCFAKQHQRAETAAGLLEKSRNLRRPRPAGAPVPPWDLAAATMQDPAEELARWARHRVSQPAPQWFPEPANDLASTSRPSRAALVSGRDAVSPHQEPELEEEEEDEDEENGGADSYEAHPAAVAFPLGGASANRHFTSQIYTTTPSPNPNCKYTVSRRRGRGTCACRRRQNPVNGCKDNFQTDPLSVIPPPSPPFMMPNMWLLHVLYDWKGDKSGPMMMGEFNVSGLNMGIPDGEIQMYFLIFDLDHNGWLDPLERFFAVLDSDLNGYLCRNELTKWDTDQDGSITESDLLGRAPTLAAIFTNPPLSAMLSTLDKDQNGKISLQEWDEWRPEAAAGDHHGVFTAPPLSQQDMISCGSSERQEYRTPYCLLGPGKVKLQKYTQGCSGATLFNVAMYLHRYGVPTRDCSRYDSGGEVSYKKYFVSTEKAITCESLEKRKCHKERSRFKMSLPIRLLSDDYANIKKAIWEGGSVMAGIKVYTYFMSKYKFPTLLQMWPDGIYRVNKEVEKFVGAHAVLLHGWGKAYKTGVQFYEGRNSWGTGWGKVGLFRILMHFNSMITEVMHSSADPKEDMTSSPCIEIHQDGETKSCTFTNTCADEVISYKYSYLGMENNCGRWTAEVPALFPGEQHTQDDALFCQIVEESKNAKYTPFDTKSYFVDVTETYKPFPCVLKNTWSGPLDRLLCCGGNCIKGVVNQPTAFDEIFCSDEKCKASGVGSQRFEKVAENPVAAETAVATLGAPTAAA